MDWARRDIRISAKDLTIFEYFSRPCKLIRVSQMDATQGVTTTTVSADEEWVEVLNKEQEACNRNVKLGGVVILGDRAKDMDEYKIRNPASLSKLPFSKATWYRLSEVFYVHGSVAKLINKGIAHVFSRTQTVIGSTSSPAIVYNCRSSASWPGDMALTMTWFPQRNYWYAVFYGCDSISQRKIEGRIRNSEDAICHPLILPGIFAETERERQTNMVRIGSSALVATVADLNSHNYDWSGLSSRYPHEEEDPSEDGFELKEVKNDQRSIDPWLNTYHMKNGLENWKEQLTKMVVHADELEEAYFRREESASDEVNAFRDAMRRSGRRIKERLQDIIRDYDEQIRECNKNLDGMTLANQMAHTRANMEIAVRTRLDSSHMKSIALLTMIFLPATFVATLFSMTFFNWQPKASDNEVVVSPRFWIYPVAAGSLTILTVMTWYCCLRKRKPQKREENLVDGREFQV